MGGRRFHIPECTGAPVTSWTELFDWLFGVSMMRGNHRTIVAFLRWVLKRSRGESHLVVLLVQQNRVEELWS